MGENILFKLSPSSGYPNSYYDIQFMVMAPKAEKLSVRFMNMASGEFLDILSVTDGVISNNTVAATSRNTISGYFNLFNEDKMNTRLQDYNQVVIRAFVEKTYEGKTETVSKEHTFYSEAASLDAGISPVGVVIRDGIIDTEKQAPFEMIITATQERKIEFCFMSSDNKKSFVDFVVKKGVNTLYIPVSFLFSELSPQKNTTLSLHYVVFEGIGWNQFLERKLIPIHTPELRFKTQFLTPVKQTRLGPVGELPDSFVVSHLGALTHKAFSKIGDPINQQKNRKLSLFFFEALSLLGTHSIETFAKENPETTYLNPKLVQQSYKEIVVQPKLTKKPYLSAYSSGASVAAISKKPGGGCGCTRNKNA